MAFSFVWRGRIVLRECLAALAVFLLAGNVGAAETHWRDGYIPSVSVVSQDGQSLRFCDDERQSQHHQLDLQAPIIAIRRGHVC
jgi:hypothetical protein